MNTGRIHAEPLHDAPRTPGNPSLTNARSSTGLDDVTYDLVTIMHAKAKGLKAYEIYFRDADGNEDIVALLQQIRMDDLRHITQLRECLAKTLSGDGMAPLKDEEPVDRE